jgi:putative endonuclease
MWHTYIVECRDGTYYVGITTDLWRRLAMHNAGVASRYTRGRRPVRYRYAEPHATQSDARKREIELKRWRKEKKQTLFSSIRNPFAGRHARHRKSRLQARLHR